MDQTEQTKPTDKIDSIDDLKKINFSQFVPKHSLLLLHWFANTVKIDDDGIWLTFDPKRQYGSHEYGNQDGLLPQGRRYYTVGDLNRDKHEFPSYMYYELRENVGKNIDRIIFSVNDGENGAGPMIEAVYLTQHKINKHQMAAYDRKNTYLVSLKLLKQIRRFSEIGLKQSLWMLNSEFGSNANDFQLLDFYEQWTFSHLELLLFTVTQKTQYFQKRKRYRVAAHATTFPSLHTGLGFAVGVQENRDNRVKAEGPETSAGGLQVQSNETKPEVMTGVEQKNRKGPTRNEYQPATRSVASSSQTTEVGFALCVPKNRYDQKRSEGSEISARGLQDQSNETKPELMTGAHGQSKRVWSNVSTRNECQPVTRNETFSSQTTVRVPNTHNQKEREGSEIPAGGLRVQSTEAKPEVTTGTEQKQKIVGRNVPAHSECQPAAHAAASSSQTPGSEISAGGLQVQRNERKPEVMTGAHGQSRKVSSNMPTNDQCQPAAHAKTSSSQTTVHTPQKRDSQKGSEGPETSAGGLQVQSNDTKPEVMTGVEEKKRIAGRNIPTRDECQPAAHAAASSSQTTALGFVVNRDNQVMTEDPEISAGGLQGQSNETKLELMTVADEINKVIWSNMPTCNECQPAAHVASSSSQTTVLAVGIPEHMQSLVDGEGSGIPSKSLEGLQNHIGDIKLEVVTGTDGKARIIWSNISSHPTKQDMMVVLFKNNEDQDASKSYKLIESRDSGTYDTSVPLNEGLQARLLNVKKWFFFWKGVGQEICRSAEFKSPEPVKITGYEASLQLFVRDAKACARLFVKKSFSEWKTEFKESWVGFYTSADKTTEEHKHWQWQWQWATKFKPCYGFEDSTYDVYEYDSGRAITQGVQARFMLRYEVVKACTPSWK